MWETNDAWRLGPHRDPHGQAFMASYVQTLTVAGSARLLLYLGPKMFISNHTTTNLAPTAVDLTHDETPT